MSGVPCISTDSSGRPTVVPCPATPTPGFVQAETIAAYLYWETVESTPNPAGAKAFFDGNPIVGSLRGSPNNAACWSSGGTSGSSKGAGRVYRADVRQYLPLDSNKVRVSNGKHTIKLPDKGGNGNGNTNYTDGATLVVIYRIAVPGYPLLVPLRAVSIYDGASTITNRVSTPTPR